MKADQIQADAQEVLRTYAVYKEAYKDRQKVERQLSDIQESAYVHFTAAKERLRRLLPKKLSVYISESALTVDGTYGTRSEQIPLDTLTEATLNALLKKCENGHEKDRENAIQYHRNQLAKLGVEAEKIP